MTAPFNSFQTGESSISNRVLLPLDALLVVCGVALGERLETGDDLMVGDVYRLRNREFLRAYCNDTGRAAFKLHFEDHDVGFGNVSVRVVSELTLISDVGRRNAGRVVVGPPSWNGQSYLMLANRLDASREHVLIAKSD